MNFLKLFEKPSLIATHRGARLSAPENTFKAMQMSEGKCDFIELDLQLSRDRVPIFIHDSTLTRTTNVLSVFKDRDSYLVSNFTFDELSRLDYGDNESVLTLDKALEYIKINNLYLNIEIKDISDVFNDEDVVDTLLKRIYEFGVQDSMLISSFRREYLSLIRERGSEVATALLAEKTHPDNLIKYLKIIGVNAYNMSDELVDEKIVKELREAGYFVNVYTVNDKNRQKKLFNMGVNSVYSDI